MRYPWLGELGCCRSCENGVYGVSRVLTWGCCGLVENHAGVADGVWV